MINYRFILKLYGKLLYIESAFVGLCALVALFYSENDFDAFLWTSILILGFAKVLSNIMPIKDKTLTRKDGYFIVSSIWILFSIFGCLPYIFSGHITHFADAFFETMSGFTTTGSTIITNIEILPHATLFWRSLTQWLGGMGIITLFIALLPSLGIESRDLFIAEDTSPVHSKIGATFTFTTRSLWGIYIILTVLCILMLWLGDMGWFDSVNHALTALSSGGFSTKNSSVAYWDSPYIHYVIILFMFIAGVNFTQIFTLFNRHWKNFFKDSEISFYLWLTLICSAIIAVAIYLDGFGNLEESIRGALFQVVSIITTTGFVTADYLQWPSVIMPILVFVMFIGSCSGSTAGGLKCIRGIMVLKNILAEMKRIIHPNGVILVKYNGKSVRPEVTNGIVNFFILYVIVIGIATAMLFPMLDQPDWQTAGGAVLTSISNVGPGFGKVGPVCNFAWMGDGATLFCALLMLVGRLELFTVLVLFTREFWRR